MNITELETLENLLKRAVSSAVIKDSYGGSPIATGQYLALLASHRQSFDPDQRMLAARFQPEIRNPSVRERLVDVIRTTLGRYIHNDRLQSAMIVTGGWADGFKIDDLVNHLVTIAFCRGAQQAARTFYECAYNTSVNMQSITLLDGIRIERNIEISDGIRLAPIPDSSTDFPPYIIAPPHGQYSDYFGRTLIIVDERVSPIFAHPSEMSTDNLPSPFIRSSRDTVFRNFVVAEFCEALSLSANHIVNCTAWWTHVDPDEAFAVTTTGRAAAWSSLFHEKNKAIEVDVEDIRKAMSLYSTRRELRPEVARKLRVPIDRWMRSKADRNPVDGFINVGTALESIYLNDAGYTGELRFRMALRAAWYLGDGMDERSTLLNDFKNIYDRRSKAVHTGNLREKERAPEFMATAQDLCRKSIVEIIEDGDFPDWDRLVLGG